MATDEERLLRPYLVRGLNGYRFAFQAPVLGWVPDFYCSRLRLVVELDGGSHKGRERQDAHRTDVLQANHIKVVRIPTSSFGRI